MKARLKNHLDGLVSVYEDKPVRNNFGAKVNNGELEEVFLNCPYQEMSCRQSDNELAQSMDFSLSMKIRVQYCNKIKRRKKYKAKIDGALYNVQYTDSDGQNLYMYLEYVREVTA